MIYINEKILIRKSENSDQIIICLNCIKENKLELMEIVFNYDQLQELIDLVNYYLKMNKV